MIVRMVVDQPSRELGPQSPRTLLGRQHYKILQYLISANGSKKFMKSLLDKVK